MMRTSAKGQADIRGYEALRLTAYLDSAGVPTIGYGHTGRASPPLVHMGMKCTTAQAVTYFSTDLAPFETVVNNSIKKTMSQNEFDAMVSLSFNIGTAAFAGSSVVKAFNSGNISLAANDFLLWDKSNGKVVAGLLNRRKSERALFLAK